MKRWIALAILSLLMGCGSSDDGENASLPSSTGVAAEATVDNGEAFLLDAFDTDALDIFLTDEDATSGGKPATRAQTACPGGGLASLDTQSGNGKNTLQAEYENCTVDGVTFNGQFKVQTQGENALSSPRSITTSFPSDLTMERDGNQSRIRAGSYLELSDIEGEYEELASAFSYTQRHQYQVETAARIYRSENFLTTAEGNGSALRVCYKEGRHFFNDAALYLDVDETFDAACNYPFTYRLETPPALESGKVRLVGENDETILLEVTGDNLVTISVGPITKTVDMAGTVETYLSNW